MEKIVEKKSHTSLELVIVIYIAVIMVIPNSVIGFFISSYVGNEVMKKIVPIYFTAVILSLLLTFLLVRIFITIYARRIIHVLSRISNRDLTVAPVTFWGRTNKEFTLLVNSANRMLLSLKEIVQDIAGKSQTLAAASEELTASTEENKATADEIARSVQLTSDAADHQSASIQELTREAEKIHESVMAVSRQAHNLNKTSEEAQHAVSSGITSVDVASDQMNIMKQSIKALAGLIGHLHQQIQKVDDIVGAINDIADQTQLLSLNAAVEAAHAGEYGKSFAVVAAEIQKLSVQSADSANEIGKIIAAVQEDTGRVVTSMHKGMADVDKGAVAVNKSNESFQKIENSMKTMRAEVTQVAASIQIISQSVQKSVEKYEPIEAMARQTSASTQSISAAAEQQSASMEDIANNAASLAQIADEMNQLVAGFKQ